MGKYERSAVELLELAFGGRWIRDDSRVFSFGPDAGTGEVDGVIDQRIAVEIGVGSPKQIRGCVLDLGLHPYEGKLLLLVDTPAHSTDRMVMQAAAIMSHLGCSGIVFRVSGDENMAVEASQLAERVETFYADQARQGQVWALSRHTRRTLLTTAISRHTQKPSALSRGKWPQSDARPCARCTRGTENLAQSGSRFMVLSRD